MLILSFSVSRHMTFPNQDLMFGNLRSGALNVGGTFCLCEAVAVDCQSERTRAYQSPIARSPSPDISVDNGDLRPFAPQAHQRGVIESYTWGPFAKQRNSRRGCFRTFSQFLRSADSLPESRQADYNAALQVHEDSLCSMQQKLAGGMSLSCLKEQLKRENQSFDPAPVSE